MRGLIRFVTMVLLDFFEMIPWNIPGNWLNQLIVKIPWNIPGNWLNQLIVKITWNIPGNWLNQLILKIPWNIPGNWLNLLIMKILNYLIDRSVMINMLFSYTVMRQLPFFLVYYLFILLSSTTGRSLNNINKCVIVFRIQHIIDLICILFSLWNKDS